MVKNTIKVFARLKPEKSRKGLVSYKIHRRPRKHSDEDFLVLTAPHRVPEYIDNRPETWNFSFHRIFGDDVDQEEIFHCVAHPIVERVFDGYNATIFAYGQTGSGKTYTISGEPGVDSERGILPRTLEYIFQTIRKNPENLYSVEVGYLEIYNENGYDLLLERKQREAVTRLEDLPRVTIQEDENGKLHLKNLSFRTVENENEALEYLKSGENYRAVSETPMNPRSSRSHCIFTIILSVKKFGANRYSSAKMHLVDLAGSERVYKCAIQGTILNEAKHINLSLHFLEQVIVCLGQENVSHVPYRNSLLTSILRDSLGGNCLTTMLANLSVSSFNLEETISTCRFAQRVALVKNDVNLSLELDTNSENKLLKIENEKLRKQIEDLKKNLNPENHKLDYYKNLVVQRDQEISHLLEILRKENEKRENFKETELSKPIKISTAEKSTQICSGRSSPRKNNRNSSPRCQVRKKLMNSPRRSPSPKSWKMKNWDKKSNFESSKSEILHVPPLDLGNDFFEVKSTPSLLDLRINSETTRVENNLSKIVEDAEETKKLKISILGTEGKNSDEEKFGEDVEEKLSEVFEKESCSKIEKIPDMEETPNKFFEEESNNIFEKESCSKIEKQCPNIPEIEKKIEKKSPREKNLGFPQNVMKMIRNSRNRNSGDDDDDSHSSTKSETPKSSFRTPHIFRNILCVEKNLGEENLEEKPRKVDENFGKLPLTGDPEIDEEIIAFYRAKRGGGTY